MNDYRRAMDSCPIPEGLEERLARRVLAAEPAGKKFVIRPMSFGKKALLAAALAALLSVSVGAAVLVEWDAVFTERFGRTGEETPAAESLFQSVGTESVCGGVTLRIPEALGDSQTIHYILEYRLPEGTDLALVERAWDGEYPDYQVHLPTIEYFRTDAVTWADYEAEMGHWWPDIDWRLHTGETAERDEYFYRRLPHPLEAHRFTDGGAAGSRTVDFDRETGTMRFLNFCHRERGDLTERPLTVLVYPPSITVEGETTALAEHPALITFRPTQTAKAKTGEAAGEGFRLNISVSPFSVTAQYYGGEFTEPGALAKALTLVTADGTELPLRSLSMGHSGSAGGGGVTYTARFDEILNTENVTAVRFGTAEFPLAYEE